MKRYALLPFALIITALTACGDTDILGVTSLPPRDARAPLQTDTTYYPLRRDWVGLATEIRFVFENQTIDTLYVVNCRGNLAPILEKRVGGEWEMFWAPAMQLCLSPPIVLEPGAALADTLELWGALPGHSAGPEFASHDVQGIYRIVLHNVVTHYDMDRQGFGDPVAVEDRVSNRFVLDDPRE